MSVVEDYTPEDIPEGAVEVPNGPAPAAANGSTSRKAHPLQAPEVELHLLAGALDDPERLHLLTADLFSDSNAAAVFRAARALSDAGKPLDVPLLAVELRQGKAPRAVGTLEQLAAGLPTFNPEHFEEHLKTAEWFAHRRELVDAARQVAIGATDGDDVLPAAEDLARKAAGSGTSALPASWMPRDLSQAVSGEVEPELPTIGEVPGGLPLFYRGRVNALNGQSGAGKGLVTLAIVADLLKAGEVAAMLDYEDTEDSIAGRLMAMGVPAEVILERFIYIRPDEPLSPAGCVALCRMLKERTCALVLLDTVGEAMAMDGVNPNADDEVARWFRMLPRRLAHEAGCGVLIMDHVPKEQPGQSPVQLFAIGSQRKRAALDGVGYMLTQVKAPSRGVDGLLKLTTAKDRHGARSVGSVAAEVSVSGSASGDTLAVWFGPSSTPVAQDGKYRPTGYMEKVSATLAAHGKPVSKAWLEHKDRKLGKAEHVRRALELLVSEGFVREVPNAIKGQYVGFEHAKAYVEDNDEEAGERPQAGPF